METYHFYTCMCGVCEELVNDFSTIVATHQPYIEAVKQAVNLPEDCIGVILDALGWGETLLVYVTPNYLMFRPDPFMHLPYTA